MNGLTKDERRVGLFEPGEVPKVGGLAELVASRVGELVVGWGLE